MATEVLGVTDGLAPELIGANGQRVPTTLVPIPSGGLVDPNYITVANDGVGSHPGILTGASVSFGGSYTAISKTGSGVIYIDGEISGTQTVQEPVTVAMYRDAVSGPTSVLLGTWTNLTGNAGGSNYFAFSVTAIDVLPDSAPHEYIIVATGSGGSTLTVPLSVAGSGPANFQLFELR